MVWALTWQDLGTKKSRRHGVFFTIDALWNHCEVPDSLADHFTRFLTIHGIICIAVHKLDMSGANASSSRQGRQHHLSVVRIIIHSCHSPQMSDHQSCLILKTYTIQK
jgi:hypothetical protein